MRRAGIPKTAPSRAPPSPPAGMVIQKGQIEIHGQRTADKGPHAHEGRLAQVEQSGIAGGDLKSDHGNTDHGGHADHGDEADAEDLRKSRPAATVKG